MSTYITSDIHGAYGQFMTLLTKLKYNSTTDSMIILGDVIDRGKENLKLLSYVRNEPSMMLLKGNHELFMERYLIGEQDPSLWSKWGGADTIAEIEELSEAEKQDWYQYLVSLPHYHEITTKHGNTVLTHSGFLADAYVEQEDQISVIASIEKAIRQNEFAYLVSEDLHYISGRQRNRLDRFLIVGHVPAMKLNEDKSCKIVHNDRYLCIDSGEGFRNEGGKLSAYRVEDEAEFYV